MWDLVRKTIREKLLRWARKNGVLVHRGPLQGVTSLHRWLAANPKLGKFLYQSPSWVQPCEMPLTQAMFRHENFERLRDGIPHAETFVAELAGAEVTGPSVGVITPDRFLLREVSTEFGLPAESHGAMRRFSFQRPRPLRGTWALLAVTGGGTYYHHLLEALPRFHLLEMAGIRAGQIDGWIVNGRTAGFQSATWKALGIPPEKLVTLDRKILYRADRLLVPSLPSHPGHTPPWVVGFLQNLLVGNSGLPTPPKQLWISRRLAKSRRFLREKEWVTQLEHLGFRESFCEKLSLQEQVRMFAGAAHVAGAHGAGMANLAFAPKGTRVTEFFNPRYVNTCYWTLANAAGLRYGYFIGEAQPGDLPTAPGDSRGDIGLAEETSQIALRWIGSGTRQ